MKKIILIIVLLSGYLFAQSWNSIVTTTINEPNLIKLENLSNKDGIHIVVQNSNSTNSIKYYKINSSGSVQTTTTIESQGGAEFPSIAGDNDNLYISYRLGNNVVTKKYNYSNGTWDAQNSITLNNNDCDGVDIKYDLRGLHLVYSESDNGSAFETHYWLYASSSPTKHKVVSDQSNYIGSTPTLTISSGKAHVGFNSSGGAKTRDKNLNTDSWESTQAVVSSSFFEKVQNGCDKLFDFYHVFAPDLVIVLYVKERDIDGTSWSTPLELNGSVWPLFEGMVTTTATNDSKTHILYDHAEQLSHRSYDCSTSLWSDEDEVDDYSTFIPSSSLSSTSNDLYVVYREDALGSTYLKYRQYDAAPLTPQNLTVAQSKDDHPFLQWNDNYEPDLDQYYIYRYDTHGGGWQLLDSTANTEYEDVTLDYCSGQCANQRDFYFRVAAVDVMYHESAPSDSVVADVVGDAPSKSSADNSNPLKPIEYSLGQNYPNPFNPSTKISYSVVNDANVSIKIYDILGTEVTELVNAKQTAGNYEIKFSSTSLASGVYIYRIVASNNGRVIFTDSKQMILLR